ncbi:MAG: peptidoglycan-binding protein [Bryobacteraceae bacterium]
MVKAALICCPVAALMTVLAWSAVPAPQPQKKPVAGKAPATHAKTAVSAHKTTTKSAPRTGASRHTVRRTGTRQARTPAVWRPRQVAPSPERYKEIQDALVSRGYLQPEQATGAWDQNSVDALKRFQAEQKLESSGKINSLSLIALGLGPKHESPPAKPVADPGSPQIQ